MTNKNVNQKYDGSSNEKGLPNGNGTLTTYWDDKVRCIEQGFWQEGFLVEGSETIFWQDWDKERAPAYPFKYSDQDSIQTHRMKKQIEYEWFIEACEDEYKTYPIKFKIKYFKQF